MISKRFPLCILCFLSLLLLSCKGRQKENTILIATASNMQFAIKEIATAFTENTGIETEIIVGASGNLAAQIKEGAPYNVFLSADMKYPQFLYQNGLAKNPPEVYAYGQLILWTCQDGISADVDSLVSTKVKHIALANPDLAPYGKAALEVLKKHALTSTVQAKLVYGESIAQANQFIYSGAAEVGFTALAVVYTPKFQNKGTWTIIPTDSYSPIAQGIILINSKEAASDNVRKFYNFLFEEQGKRILGKYGYITDE